MKLNFRLNESNVYEHHINCIYRCGMLLDEHEELLQEFWRLPKVNDKEISWTMTCIPLLCGGYFTYKMKTMVPLLFTSLPLGVKFAGYLIKIFKYKKYMKKFKSLTITLRKIFDFNKSIQQYYERRKLAINKLEASSKSLLEGHLKEKLTNLIHAIFMKMESTIPHIQNQLSRMNQVVPSEFLDICTLNLEDKVVSFKEGDIEPRFMQLQMCYLLATSTFLFGIAIALSNCPKYVLTEIVLISETFLTTKFNDMRNIFEDATYNILEEQMMINERYTATDSTVTVCKLIDCLQLTFYAGVGVQKCILKGNQDYIRDHIRDLEKLFKESSDLLLHLQYEFNKHSGSYKMEDNITERVINDNFPEEVIIRYDDLEEPVQEQEFSLSIHGSDVESDIGDDAKLDYEQLREQVRAQKVIIKELNDELLRRKLIKEDSSCFEKKHELPTIANDSFPPENFSFGNMDFLAQIKAIAQNRGTTESVFGDDDSETSNT